jgi:hypothetical protein
LNKEDTIVICIKMTSFYLTASWRLVDAFIKFNYIKVISDV